jgi:hypothetical protein
MEGEYMEGFLVLAASLLTPILVSWLKDHRWPDWAKVLLTLSISLGAGTLIALAEGKLDLHNIAGTGGIIFTLAVAFYKAAFQGTDFNRHLEGVPVQVAKGARPAAFVFERSPIVTDRGSRGKNRY